LLSSRQVYKHSDLASRKCSSLLSEQRKRKYKKVRKNQLKKMQFNLVFFLLVLFAVISLGVAEPINRRSYDDDGGYYKLSK
jgi:hypothetical protein